MTETNGTRAQFSPADAVRIARLSEEVHGRLEEMARIAARTAGMRLDKEVVRKFVPRDLTARDAPTIVDLEILDNFLGPGTQPCCLVGLSNGDWFVECPCGAAG